MPRTIAEARLSVSAARAQQRDKSYEKACRSCTRRVLAFFLTALEDGEPLFLIFLKFSDNCYAAHSVARGNEERFISIFQQKADEPAPETVGPQRRRKRKRRKLRSAAQDEWLRKYVSLNPSTFCTAEGCEAYETFLHSLVKVGKKGREVMLTAGSMRGYWKGVCKHLKGQVVDGENYVIRDSMIQRIKAIHKNMGEVEAQNRENGDLDATIGADCIPLDLHDFICKMLLERGGKEDIKVLLIILLAFNNFWRINKVFNIRLSAGHMSWKGDSLRIWLFSSKADKQGKLKENVHVYANSLEPHKCVVTILGLYLLLHEGEIRDWLFPVGKCGVWCVGKCGVLFVCGVNM